MHVCSNAMPYFSQPPLAAPPVIFPHVDALTVEAS